MNQDNNQFNQNNLNNDIPNTQPLQNNSNLNNVYPTQTIENDIYQQPINKPVGELNNNFNQQVNNYQSTNQNTNNQPNFEQQNSSAYNFSNFNNNQVVQPQSSINIENLTDTPQLPNDEKNKSIKKIIFILIPIIVGIIIIAGVALLKRA